MQLKKCKITWCWRNFASSTRTKRYGCICGAPKSSCLLEEIARRENVRAVLDKTIKDSGPYIGRLTDPELEFCLQEEKRKTAHGRLAVEKEKRQPAKKAAVSA